MSKRRTLALSPTMQAILAEIERRGGEIECWIGGFWTYPGCPKGDQLPDGTPIPEWYASSDTIRALVRRGKLVVTKRTNSGWPIAMKIAPKEELTA